MAVAHFSWHSSDKNRNSAINRFHTAHTRQTEISPRVTELSKPAVNLRSPLFKLKSALLLFQSMHNSNQAQHQMHWASAGKAKTYPVPVISKIETAVQAGKQRNNACDFRLPPRSSSYQGPSYVWLGHPLRTPAPNGLGQPSKKSSKSEPFWRYLLLFFDKNKWKNQV